jgi:hypothetical protein
LGRLSLKGYSGSHAVLHNYFVTLFLASNLF